MAPKTPYVSKGKFFRTRLFRTNNYDHLRSTRKVEEMIFWRRKIYFFGKEEKPGRKIFDEREYILTDMMIIIMRSAW